MGETTDDISDLLIFKHTYKYLVIAIRETYYTKLIGICENRNEAVDLLKVYLLANPEAPLSCYIQEQEIITLINDKL